MTPPNLENHKFYIIVPQEATNYFPNPRFDGPDYGEDLTVYGIGYSIAAVATEQRRGAHAIKITPAASATGGVYYTGFSVVNGTSYTFSCDVKGVEGETYTISIRDGAGYIEAFISFVATGYWQRKEVTAIADETVATWKIYLSRDGGETSTAVFYTDGWQFEDGDKATTFIHGYEGEGYYWEGRARNSNSVRLPTTGMGGKILDISDYATVAGIYGLGMGNFEQIMTPMANGGDLYQQMIRKPRMFSLQLHYTGSMNDITAKRNVIMDAVRPDILPGKEMKIRYQGFDSNGDEATNPVDIICVPQSSHTDPAQECAFNEDTLVFTIPSGLLEGAFDEGGALSLYEEIAVEGIVMRDNEGNWNNMDGGIDNGLVYCMAEAPNGDIYVGGTFTSVNGVANTAYLAKWDGSNWSTVTGTDTLNANVLSLCFDADGNLYIGGAFSNLGDANGDYIVKWDGSSLSSLGTGMNNSVWALAIDPDTGYLYAGGIFTLAGGVAGTALIAYWDGTAWNPLNTGLGTLTKYVQTLKFGPDGNLYIGGSFTDTAYPYICYWDGSSFNPVGTAGDINGTVQAIEFNNTGELIVSGLFTNVASIADADYIAKFNGTSWFPIGTGLNNGGYGIFIDDNNDLYIGGQFTVAGGLTLSDRVAVYSNGSWRMLDIDLPGSDAIQSILIDSRDNLYIGGNFSSTAHGNAVTSKVAANVENYSGSANGYPFIQITGPGVLQTIVNWSSKKAIKFNGLTLQAGEWLNLILDPHNVKVVSGWRGNCLKYIIPGSDIANFYLTPSQVFKDGQAGQNNIGVLMPSGTTSNSAGFICWRPKYWSIEGAKYE